jgi:hypothetical protein
MKNNNKQNYFQIFFVYLAASLFIGIPFALLSGVWPKSITGWILIFIFGFPTLILGEFIGEKLFSDKISLKIDKDKKDRLISIRRTAYALIIGIITTLFITLIGFFLRKHVGAHFSIQ